MPKTKKQPESYENKQPQPAQKYDGPVAQTYAQRDFAPEQDQVDVQVVDEERNLLRTLIDHLPAYVYVKDAQSRFLLGNSAVAQVMGVESADELIGKTDFDFYPKTLAAQYYADEVEVMRSGRPLVNKTEPLIDAAGDRRWLLTTKMPLRNASGEITGLVGIGRDITEQRLSERRIRLLQTITQNISEAPDFDAALSSTLSSIGQVTNWDYGEAWMLDEEKQVMICSPAWYSSSEKLSQFRSESETLTFSFNKGLPGRAWASEEPDWVQDVSTLPESHFARRRLTLKAGLKAGLAVPFLANHRVVVVLVFFMFEASPEDEEMVDLISTVATQLGVVLHRKKVQGEREQLLEAVGRHREELRSLAGRLAEIQEAEREQLARELHDQVGQNLTALGFNLDAMWARLAQTSAGTGSIKDQLDDSLALVEETTDRIRNLLVELRPPMLNEYGLVDALEWHAERFTTRTGIPVEIQNRMLGPRLPASTETALFRICQEALTNTAKYAQAKQITITLSEQEQMVRLCIVDDGVGFNLAEVTRDKQRQNLGLLTMRERALAVGAHCQIESQLGQGTRVMVEVVR